MTGPTKYTIRDRHGNHRGHRPTLEYAELRIGELDRFQTAYAPHHWTDAATDDTYTPSKDPKIITRKRH